MIDKAHGLLVVRQVQLLDLARSSVYYLPQPTSDNDLRLMRRIDELHLEFPFAGARMLRDMLRLEKIEVGRKHVSTLMKKMGIEALYRKANTSRRDQAHRLLRRSTISFPITTRIANPSHGQRPPTRSSKNSTGFAHVSAGQNTSIRYQCPTRILSREQSCCVMFGGLGADRMVVEQVLRCLEPLGA